MIDSRAVTRDTLLRALARISRATPHFRGKKRLLNLLHPREGPPERAIRDTVELEGGLRVHCDTSSFLEWHLYFLAEIEPETTDFMRRVVRPGWTCVDAGANIGYLTLVMARTVGDAGRVYSFEALPTLSGRLAANVALNGFSNVTAETLCLGSKRGEVDFFTPRRGISNVGQSSLYLDHHPELGRSDIVRHTVSMISFDEYAEREGLRSWDFLKLDVEGAELEVLEGAKGSIRRFRPRILFEANAMTQAQAGSTNAALLDALEAHGYRFMAYEKKRGWHPMTSEERRRAVTDRDFIDNLFASPS